MLWARMAAGEKAARWVGVALVAAAGLLSAGCAIHTQGPIKEVAYDFSDHDFYDRAYAPSPKYLETDESYAVVPLRPSSAVAGIDADGWAAARVQPPPEALGLPAVIVVPGAAGGTAGQAPEAEAQAGGPAEPAPLRVRHSVMTVTDAAER